jgi:hypothetical protein
MKHTIITTIVTIHTDGTIITTEHRHPALISILTFTGEGGNN